MLLDVGPPRRLGGCWLGHPRNSMIAFFYYFFIPFFLFNFLLSFPFSFQSSSFMKECLKADDYTNYMNSRQNTCLSILHTHTQMYSHNIREKETHTHANTHPHTNTNIHTFNPLPPTPDTPKHTTHTNPQPHFSQKKLSFPAQTRSHLIFETYPFIRYCCN